MQGHGKGILHRVRTTETGPEWPVTRRTERHGWKMQLGRELGV